MSKTDIINRSRRNGGLGSVMERLYALLKDLDIKIEPHKANNSV